MLPLVSIMMMTVIGVVLFSKKLSFCSLPLS